MSWISSRNRLPVTAGHNEAPSADADSPDDATALEDEWLLVDSNGDSAPASQAQPKIELKPEAPPNPGETSTPAITVSVDIKVGRTSTISTPSYHSQTNTDTPVAISANTSPSPTAARAIARTSSTSTSTPTEPKSIANLYLRYRGTRRVLYDFFAAESNELTIRAGEEVKLLNFVGEPEGWLVAESSSGQVGWVPRAYVEDIAGAVADPIADAVADARRTIAAAINIQGLAAGSVSLDRMEMGGTEAAAVIVPPAFTQSWAPTRCIRSNAKGRTEMTSGSSGYDEDDDW